ncbi:hypothetical protein SKAU_G00086240 [Synaphobranchus kaupii]|uniref:Uncharacterized protein n=1 Tax=Synaphobranchus kaupii TaxID=118154 RepID=A0A9Q1J605_SYNKA|nr:hypothetical protein SKAU_G00086240 [Synaphobranchus kaupii]
MEPAKTVQQSPWALPVAITSPSVRCVVVSLPGRARLSNEGPQAREQMSRIGTEKERRRGPLGSKRGWAAAAGTGTETSRNRHCSGGPGCSGGQGCSGTPIVSGSCVVHLLGHSKKEPLPCAREIKSMRTTPLV